MGLPRVFNWANDWSLRYGRESQSIRARTNEGVGERTTLDCVYCGRRVWLEDFACWDEAREIGLCMKCFWRFHD